MRQSAWLCENGDSDKLSNRFMGKRSHADRVVNSPVSPSHLPYISFMRLLSASIIAVGFYLILGSTINASTASAERPFARWLVGGEAYGQGIWYSVRASHRFHANGMVSVGHSFIEIPPVDSTGSPPDLPPDPPPDAQSDTCVIVSRACRRTLCVDFAGRR